MPLIDKDLEATHVVEERKLRFEEFVREQKEKGAPKDKYIGLHTNGHRDFYGPVVYEPCFMRDGKWVLDGSKNDRVLIFTKEKDARSYADALKSILKKCGYSHSKVWVEEVSICSKSGIPYWEIVAAKKTYQDQDRYVIRIKL